MSDDAPPARAGGDAEADTSRPVVDTGIAEDEDDVTGHCQPMRDLDH